MIRNASASPRAFRICASDERPRVCRSVLQTSSGVVTAAATAPAIPPAVTWVTGEYVLVGLILSLRTTESGQPAPPGAQTLRNGLRSAYLMYS